MRRELMLSWPLSRKRQFLHLPGPTFKVARQHVADGSADFDDRITMMLYNCLIQQWDEVLQAARCGGKAGGRQAGRALDSNRRVANDSPQQRSPAAAARRSPQARGRQTAGRNVPGRLHHRPVARRRQSGGAVGVRQHPAAGVRSSARRAASENSLAGTPARLLRRVGPRRRCAGAARQTGRSSCPGTSAGRPITRSTCCKPASPTQPTPGCKSSSIATSSSTARRRRQLAKRVRRAVSHADSLGRPAEVHDRLDWPQAGISIGLHAASVGARLQRQTGRRQQAGRDVAETSRRSKANWRPISGPGSTWPFRSHKATCTGCRRTIRSTERWIEPLCTGRAVLCSPQRSLRDRQARS